MKIFTSSILAGVLLMQVLVYSQLQEVSEGLNYNKNKAEALQRELTAEINRVQDRSDYQDGEIQEKLEMIEALLSMRF